MESSTWNSYKILFSAKTDLGQKRSINEDNYLLLPEASLFCVADGAGGHSAGNKASEITVSSLSAYFKKAILPIDIDETPPTGTVCDKNSEKPLLVQAIEFANMKVHANMTSSSMASTVVACHFSDHDIMIAHVGDSRAYLIRNQSITRLTDDHSYVFELLKMGKIKEEEMETHPRRNLITRAIGPIDDVQVSHTTLTPENNDLILLCSDGLTSMVNDQKILDSCTQLDTIDQIAEGLISQANEAGGKDNITVVLIQIKEGFSDL